MSNEQDLRQVLADVFGADPASINDESSIDTVDGWTSMRHLNLVVALEERFGVHLTEQEIVEVVSIALIKAVLAEHGVSFAEGGA